MEHRATEDALSAFNSLPPECPDPIIKAGLALLPDIAGEADRSRRALVRYRIGIARIAKGEYEAAFRSLSEARQIHDDLGDLRAALNDQLAFGIIYDLSEQPESAFETFRTIRDAARDQNLPEVEEAALCNMGRISGEQNRLDEGASFLESARQLIETTENRGHQAAYLHELGRILLKQGRVEESTDRLEQAAALVGDIGSAFAYEYRITLGELYIRSARFDEAASLLRDSLDFCRSNGIRHGEIQTLFHLGNLACEIGDTPAAVEHWKSCYDLTDSMALPRYRILSGERLVEALRHSGRHEQALGYLEDIRREERLVRNERLQHTISSADQSMRIDDLEREMQAWRRRSGELERIRSDKEEAIRELETIKDIGQEITASLESETIIGVLHDRLSQLVTVDGLIVGFYDEASASLDVRYAIEKGRRLPAARHPVEEGRGLSSWVILNDEDLLLGSREEAERYDPSVTLLEGSRHISESFLIVRLKIEGRIIGVLSVQSVEPGRYRQRHLKVLQALAGFVAIALSNSSAHQNLLVAKEEIAYMATHDPLTGLPNRMQIIERLNQELKRCQRYDESLAVLFIDLDGFKEINDGHGHRAGDAVLKELSTRLTKGIRSTDAVGRLAGDEFLVILTDDCSPANGMLLAEQLRRALGRPLEFEDRELRVTASIGLAVRPDDGDAPEILVNAADQAMYDAKSGGKNRTTLHIRNES